MGGKVVGGTMETMVSGERGVEGPGSEEAEGELGLWEQVVPAVRREGDVGGREDGDKMVLDGGGGLRGVQVNVPMMQDNEEILVSCRRFDREAPGQIGGSPLGSVEGERVAVEGGVKGIGGDRGKLRDEGAVGRGSLCAFVFPGLPGRGKERGSSEAGWGGESVVWTRCLASAGRGDQKLWRERGEGTCGLGWRLVGDPVDISIYPRERARRKVESEGEPKQRCR